MATSVWSQQRQGPGAFLQTPTAIGQAKRRLRSLQFVDQSGELTGLSDPGKCLASRFRTRCLGSTVQWSLSTLSPRDRRLLHLQDITTAKQTLARGSLVADSHRNSAKKPNRKVLILPTTPNCERQKRFPDKQMGKVRQVRLSRPLSLPGRPNYPHPCDLR